MLDLEPHLVNNIWVAAPLEFKTFYAVVRVQKLNVRSIAC